MPELPDVVVYIEALERRILGERLEAVRLNSPFLLRTVDPPLAEARGRTVDSLRRVGKRIAIGLGGDLWLVLHLMIAGRLHWNRRTGASALAVFQFGSGVLSLTEAGSKKRAALHVVRDPGVLDAGGIEPLEAGAAAFSAALTASNHTLKRALTDPRIFSGIGNAYSDEILHRARLSPLALTQKLPPPRIADLHDATQAVLWEWIARLRTDEFPEKVTAFREGMAVHGRYGRPCPRCAAPVQRIRYADNETNYCPVCQTEGRVLADRGLSRLLGEDWPRSLEELEALPRRHSQR